VIRAGSQTMRAVGAAIAIALVVIAGVALPPYYEEVLVDGLINAVFAVSLNLLLGYTGLPSLGHAAYFASGAYAAGLVSLHVTHSFWIGALSGTAAGAILGAIFGVVALRTKGAYFLMITLALGQIAWAVAYSWRDVTGGDDGLRGIPAPDIGLSIVHLDGPRLYFVLTLIALVATLAATRLLVGSPFGRTLRGIKDNSVRMGALGYNVWLHRYLAFVMASAGAGFAGVLFVYHKGFVSPDVAHVVTSAQAMLMVILGGAGTLWGPVAGAMTITVLGNFASTYTLHWTLILGLLYIGVVLIAPTGIISVLARPKGSR